MGEGQSVAINDGEQELWEEVKGQLDKVCTDSIYGSDRLFREWLEIVAYWDFTNGACDYDYRITEEDSEHLKEYKRSLLEEENGPFKKLWTWVTDIAEIGYSQGGRLRCKDSKACPVFFENYHCYDRANARWERDEDEQEFNEFVYAHPVDHIPLSVAHYRENGVILCLTDNVLSDLSMAEC